MIKGIFSIIITVISGVIVFIIGQILTSIWLMPLQQYKDLKKEIVYYLTFYANVYSNVINESKYQENKELYRNYDECEDELRKISCKVKGFAETTYFFRIGIPSRKKLNETARLIMGLSNSLFMPEGKKDNTRQNEHNELVVKKIYKLLNCFYENNWLWGEKIDWK